MDRDAISMAHTTMVVAQSLHVGWHTAIMAILFFLQCCLELRLDTAVGKFISDIVSLVTL